MATGPPFRVFLGSFRTVAAAVVFLVLLVLVPRVLLVLFIGVLLSVLLSVAMGRMEGWGMPRWLAFTLTLVGFLLLALCSVAAVVLPFVAQADEFVRSLPDLFRAASTGLSRTFLPLLGRAGIGVEEVLRRVSPALATVVEGSLRAIRIASDVAVGLFLVVGVGFYLALEPERYRRGALSLLPGEWHAEARRLLDDVGAILRGWILGQVLVMVLVGSLTMVVTLALGLRFWVVLGVAAGLLEVVPFAGPILAFLPAGLIALADSPARLLWVALAYVAIQQAEANVISPLVFRQGIRLPPALVLASLAVMGGLFGFLGVVVAVPTLAALLAVAHHFSRQAGPTPPSSSLRAGSPGKGESLTGEVESDGKREEEGDCPDG